MKGLRGDIRELEKRGNGWGEKEEKRHGEMKPDSVEATENMLAPLIFPS